MIGTSARWARRRYDVLMEGRLRVADVWGPSNLTGRVLTTGKLERLRQHGEVGQYVVGLVMGFTAAEIAEKRGWSPEQLREIEAAVSACAGEILGKDAR